MGGGISTEDKRYIYKSKSQRQMHGLLKYWKENKTHKNLCHSTGWGGGLVSKLSAIKHGAWVWVPGALWRPSGLYLWPQRLGGRDLWITGAFWSTSPAITVALSSVRETTPDWRGHLVLTSSLSCTHGCVGHFSAVLIKHRDQDNLEKRGSICAYCARGVAAAMVEKAAASSRHKWG